jgi:hypothetical protein
MFLISFWRRKIKNEKRERRFYGIEEFFSFSLI